jgi:hypothetical protein
MTQLSIGVTPRNPISMTLMISIMSSRKHHQPNLKTLISIPQTTCHAYLITQQLRIKDTAQNFQKHCRHCSQHQTDRKSLLRKYAKNILYYVIKQMHVGRESLHKHMVEKSV